MGVFTSIEELGRSTDQPVYLALGMFDGVHRGHHAVLRSAQNLARRKGGVAIAFTFPEHPASYLRPEQSPRLLMNKDEKASRLLDAGMEGVVLRNFDREFAEVEAKHFPSFLVARIRSLEGMCVGENFRFGKGRSGNSDDLKKLGTEIGLSVEVAGSELLSGTPVSSSRIREALHLGQMNEVNELLGWKYLVSGLVMTGKGIGKEFGFPTINIQWNPQARPAYGVYLGRAKCASSGEEKYAVANYGLRPTVEEGITEPLLEAHILDPIDSGFGSAGQYFTMTLEAFLRPEKKFKSVEDLKTQIRHDLAEAEKHRS